MRTFGFVIACVLACTGAVNAQMWSPAGNCTTCFVEGWADIPAVHNVVNIGPDAPWAATGWDFLCANGQGADRADVFWFDAAGWGHPLPTTLVTFDRPDVRTAFVGSCPNVWWPENAGWWAYTSDVPPAAVAIGVNLWVGPYRLEASGPYLPSFYWLIQRSQ